MSLGFPLGFNPTNLKVWPIQLVNFSQFTLVQISVKHDYLVEHIVICVNTDRPI